MARIRSMKPELRTSRTVAEWPREVRYAWALLWGYCDDYGRGDDDTRLIIADLFPLDRDVTERKMDRWLTLMTRGGNGPLCRYEVAGRRYLHAINWAEHQRVSHPRSSRIPPCPIHEHLGEPPEDDGSSSGIPPEELPDEPGEEPERLRNPSRGPARARLRSREQGAGSREGERDSGAAPETRPPTAPPKPTSRRCPRHASLPPGVPVPDCGACADARRAADATPRPADRPVAEVLSGVPEFDPNGTNAAGRAAARAALNRQEAAS